MNNQNDVDPATLSLQDRKKRLIFRSWHRGTREMDILLGSFADHVAMSLTPVQVDLYERLLTCQDPDLYEWYTRKNPVPITDDNEIMQMFLSFKLVQDR